MLLEKPRQLTSEELYAGERFQSGWWVAKAQFYKLVQESVSVAISLHASFAQSELHGASGCPMDTRILADTCTCPVLRIRIQVQYSCIAHTAVLHIQALLLYCGYGYNCNTAVLCAIHALLLYCGTRYGYRTRYPHTSPLLCMSVCVSEGEGGRGVYI